MCAGSKSRGTPRLCARERTPPEKLVRRPSRGVPSTKAEDSFCLIHIYKLTSSCAQLSQAVAVPDSAGCQR